MVFIDNKKNTEFHHHKLEVKFVFLFYIGVLLLKKKKSEYFHACST